MYVVLTGAKKNVGDFLITERAKALLHKYQPAHKLVERPSWQLIDLNLAAEANAVIILGGPGYQPGFTPDVYPLTADLSRMTCPVVPLGLGWKGVPGDRDTLLDYEFTPRSLNALKHIAGRFQWLGCRDECSVQVLNRHGIENTLMTGCPVWYDLPSIGQPMRLPDRIRRIVFTPPQREIFREQSLEVARVLARRFPDAERICAFHRGIGCDSEWMSPAEANNNQRISDALSDLGFESRDVSGGTDKLSFYDDCDLHVGYRVHAHIYFLSKRRPSTLIHEDGRGRGASEALGVLGIDAFARTPVGRLNSLVSSSKLRKFSARIQRDYEPAPEVPTWIEQMLRSDVESSFARFAGVSSRIDAQLPVMQRFIQALP